MRKLRSRKRSGGDDEFVDFITNDPYVDFLIHNDNDFIDFIAWQAYGRLQQARENQDVRVLDNAIRCFQVAVEKAPPGHPNRARYLSMLADAKLERVSMTRGA